MIDFQPVQPYIITAVGQCPECGTEVRGELLAVGLTRLPEVEPLKEVIVPVVADDNSVDMGAFTLPQYVMAYDIKGFGVVGYEPFIRPVGAAVDQFACTGC